MENYIVDTTPFVTEYANALEKIFSRMGWMPERDSDKIIISVPDGDYWIYEWLTHTDLF